MSFNTVKIIQDSINTSGNRLTTFEIETYRYIWAEVLTHKMLGKNAQSCLHGDTLVYFDVPNKAKNGKKARYSMKISDLYQKWIGGKESLTQGRKNKGTVTTSVDIDKIYNEAELSLLVFNDRSRIGAMRRGKKNVPFEIVGGFIVINGGKFVEWLVDYESTKTARKSASMMKRIKAMNIRVLNEDTNEFINSNIADIMYSGTKPVYKISMENGYSIKCSADHRIFTKNGWQTLNDLGLKEIKGSYAIKSNTYVACNGEDAYKDISWLTEQRNAGRTLREIAITGGWNEKSVRYYAEKNQVSFSNKLTIENESTDYKNKDWLLNMRASGLTCGRIAVLCNTTEDRVKKECKRHQIKVPLGNILADGTARTSWNTGLSYNLSDEVKEARKLNPNMYKTGAEAHNWKGGYKMYADKNTATTGFLNNIRKKTMEKFGWKCAISGSTSKLELHHIDPVWNNEVRALDETNIIVLSSKVHKLIHAKHIELELMKWLNTGNLACDFLIEDFNKIDMASINKPRSSGATLVARYNKILNVEYISEVDVYDLEVNGDYHNFVADGVVVHNSRAVPVASVLKVNQEEPVHPIVWGKNKAGMSATEELEGNDLKEAKEIWFALAERSFKDSERLNALGLHKMWSNRPTEAYSRIKVVITGTEWDNFLWLRDDPEAAQPEIVDLAQRIKAEFFLSKPFLIHAGEAHVPYVERTREHSRWHLSYFCNGEEVTLEDALKLSASCSAQISYRALNDTYVKAMDIYSRLFSGPKPHLSPTEHQGIAMKNTRASLLQRIFPSLLEKGVSHIDRNGALWSANLKGFLQSRKIMEQTKVQ